jgi:general secretion pathway protein M
VDAQRLELARVRAAAAELQRLRATGTRARGDREGRSLLALADATARDAGLAQALKRVEPVAGNAVRASFETASFDGLVEWMELLATRYGVQASDLSAERADGVGLVNARVMLQDAP